MSNTFCFEWARLFKFGVTTLALKPQEFWDLTPAELSMMFGGFSEGATLGRKQLSELMNKFPDLEKEDK